MACDLLRPRGLKQLLLGVYRRGDLNHNLDRHHIHSGRCAIYGQTRRMYVYTLASRKRASGDAAIHRGRRRWSGARRKGARGFRSTRRSVHAARRSRRILCSLCVQARACKDRRRMLLEHPVKAYGAEQRVPLGVPTEDAHQNRAHLGRDRFGLNPLKDHAARPYPPGKNKLVMP